MKPKVLTEYSTYRKYEALHYSMLSKLKQHPSRVLNALYEEQEETEAMLYGNMVETYLFDGSSGYKNKYHIAMQPKPTAKLGEIADWIAPRMLEDFEGLGYLTNNTKIGAGQAYLMFDSNEDLCTNTLLYAAGECGYGGSWKPETVIKKIVEGGVLEYLREIWDNQEKQVVGSDQYEKARTMAIAVRNHEFTKRYFKEDIPGERETYTQVPVIWNQPVTLEDGSIVVVECKGLLDILVLHIQKKIVELGDLKITSKYTSGFPYDFMRYGLYIQGGMYTTAIEYATTSENDAVVYNPFWSAEYPPDTEEDQISPGSEIINIEEATFDLRGYKVIPMTFIVGSFQNVDCPLTFPMTKNDVTKAMYGGTLKNGNEVEGWLSLITRYLWHTARKLWLYRKEEYEAKGRISLDMFNK